MSRADQSVGRTPWSAAGPPAGAFALLTNSKLLQAALYAAVILWINAYICRPLFGSQAAYMNSMHGFWMAIAEKSNGAWLHSISLHPTWWPYWDGGIPFEFTYAPLVPALIAAWTKIFGATPQAAFNGITAATLCLIPLTLFFAAWRLTRMPGWSFAAAMIYSLTSLTQIFAPDPNASWRNMWESRRLFLAAVWDDTPHLIAVALLPLTILFLWRALETRKPAYYAATTLSISVATLASAFGITTSAIAAACVLFVRPGKNPQRALVSIFAIAILAYGLNAAFLPPSLVWAMHRPAPAHGEPGFSAGAVTALALIVFGAALLAILLRRWTSDPNLRLFAMFAYLTAAIPMIAAYLHRQLLPQASRYRFEMEIGLALIVVFGARVWIERWPGLLKPALAFVLLALAGEQVVDHHRYAKALMFDRHANSVESRISTWTGQNLPGVRVMLPGSIAQWANAFTDVPQFSGSSWSMAYNPIQQLGLDAIYNGDPDPQRDARISLAWLRAFGAGAIAVSGKDSEEYWKSFRNPAKFEGLLPVLWRDGGVTLYRVPQRSSSLAHVVPKSALAARAPSNGNDIDTIERYDAALDDATLPAASFEWMNRNRIRIHADVPRGDAVSIQVSYHSGWRAKINGGDVPLHRDGIGLMWLQPPAPGPCDIELDYGGGFEILACRAVTLLSIPAVLALFFIRPRRVRDE